MPTDPSFGVVVPAKGARMSAPETGAASPESVAKSPDSAEREDGRKRMRTARNASTFFVLAAVAISIGVFASLSVGTGWRVYTVYGGSMEPHFSQGDLIFTSSASPASIEPGEIIVFTADWASEKYQQRVVHRVAAVGVVNGEPFAYTRGDANSIADPGPVDLTSDSVRVVRFSVSNGAFWLRLLTTPYALALIVAAMGITLTGFALSRGITPSRLGDAAVWLRTPPAQSQRSTAPQSETLLQESRLG